MPQLTVRLDAVNEVLDILGKSKVTSLGESESAQVVEDRLDSVVRELQQRTWWFNRDRDIKHTLTAFGWAHLFKDSYIPEDVRWIGPSFRTAGAGGLWIAERDGRRVYDRDRKTFVWNESPPNKVVDPFDLTTGNWTPANLNVSAITNVDPPGFTGSRNIVMLLEETAALGTLSQSILSSEFSDGATYVTGGYFRSGVVGSTSASIQLNGTSQALMSWDPTTGERLTLTGDAIDGDVILMEEPGGWAFVYMEREWETAQGNMTLLIAPGTSAATDSDVYATGISVMQKGASGPEFHVARSYPFEDLPHTARAYVIRKAATEVNDKFGGTRDRRRHLFARETEAKQALQRADAAHGDGWMLRDSQTVARVTGTRRRRPVLDSLGADRVVFTN